ncbi:MAG: hypothetical protein WDA00_07765, partial [Eubacteriales bacterium]
AVILSARSGPVALQYRRLRVDQDLYHYLLSYYKYQILIGIKGEGVSDTPAFWAAPYEGNPSLTNEQYYRAMAELLIKQTIVAAYHYDAQGYRLSADERAAVNGAVADVLTYGAGGDKRTFNEKAARYGFDYDAFRRAALYLYKAHALRARLYADTSMTEEEADTAFAAFLGQHVGEVVLREQVTGAVDFAALPYNSELVIRSFTQ